MTVVGTPLFGNAINLLNAYVEAETGIFVGTKVPADRPKRFIRTLRTGGFRRDAVTDVARITFECWAPSSTEAERDAQIVRDLLSRATGTVLSSRDGSRFKIHRVEEVAGPADSPDLDTASPRYTLTSEVHLRGRMLRSSS